VCSTTSKPILYAKAKNDTATPSLSDDPPELEDEMDNWEHVKIDELPGIKVGDKVRYVRHGVTKPGILVNLLLDPSRTQLLYTIRCAGNEVLQTTKEFIKKEEDEEITAIPSTIEDYVRRCSEMDREQLQRIINPKAMTSTQQEWLRWHERLNHMSSTQMRRLLEKGVLPKLFSKLHAIPLCLSCAFGESKRKVWRTKDGFGSIRKADHLAPGKLVCIDQLISSQLGLVPQASGYLTASRIWACNIFLDVYSGYGYRFMMRDTTLNQTIQAK